MLYILITNVRELSICQVKATTGELLARHLASERHEFSCTRYSTAFKKKKKFKGLLEAYDSQQFSSLVKADYSKQGMFC